MNNQNKLSFEIDSYDLFDAMSKDEKAIPNAVNIPHREMNEEITKHSDKAAFM